MNKIKNYAKTFEPEVVEMAEQAHDNGLGKNIALMPDTHVGKGVAIGFTAEMTNKIVPNMVGVDIGCGMSWTKLEMIPVQGIDLKKLDNDIKKLVPSGFKNFGTGNYRKVLEINKANVRKFFSKLKLKYSEKQYESWVDSIGTLGGGNHFIEVSADEKDDPYIIVHTGSRGFGHYVATYYQKMAEENYANKKQMVVKKYIDIFKTCKSGEDYKEQNKLKELELNEFNVEKGLEYLEGQQAQDYLNDMRIAQNYAEINRESIINVLLYSIYDIENTDEKEFIYCHFEVITTFPKEYIKSCHHNFIGDDNVIRKGATSAMKGEELIIPINMRDGSILAIGKGNKGWNNSAPHGAGRLMSRTEAKKKLSLDNTLKDLRDNNVYSSTMNPQTLDESPEAYKDMKEIIEQIEPTAKVVKILKPVYNYKG